MHRHGYKGRKLGRKRDQRRNLLKGLATSLFTEEHITTTLPKAKEVLPYAERLVTKAKTGTLAGRRAVIAGVTTREAAFKLVDEIAPRYTDRSSGHIRLKKVGVRRGDDAMMATLSFVEPKTATTPAKKQTAPKTEKKTEAKSKSTSSAKTKTATKEKAQ